MEKLDDINKIKNEIIAELSDKNFLICTEGKERYWTTDGKNNDMSSPRVIAFLANEIQKRYEEKTKSIPPPVPPMEKEEISALPRFIANKVLSQNIIKEALASMPGWPTGLTNWDEETFLVRRGLSPVKAVKGKWKELRNMIETFFGRDANDSHYEEQLHAFYCLVRAKLLQMSSSNNDRGSCPMLVMMSEPNTGKSFIMYLLAYLLGQTEKTVDPSKENNGWSDSYLSSPVIFYDEASREEYGFSGGNSREKNAEHFKSMEYSSSAEIARRGYTAQSWPAVWLWARAFNINSRAAILQTPIPSENAMDDKLILARVYRADIPFPEKEDSETKSKRLRLLKEQLPAFAYFLIKEFPKQRNDQYLKDPSGRPYRNETHPSIHPEVIGILTNSENDSAKAITLKDFLDVHLLHHQFTAGEILAETTKICSERQTDSVDPSYSPAHAVLKMFKSAEAIGRTLSQMSLNPDSGITRHQSGNTNRYEYMTQKKEAS